MSNLNKYIGAKIKEIREAKEFTQEMFGSLIGLERSSIINVESGRHGLNTQRMYIICCILKCTPNDLFPVVQKGEVKIIERTKRVVKNKKVRTAKLTGINMAKL